MPRAPASFGLGTMSRDPLSVLWVQHYCSLKTVDSVLSSEKMAAMVTKCGQKAHGCDLLVTIS